MIYSAISRADAAARRHFIYKPDGKIDTWTSHRADVEADKIWMGDCDDLAHTVLDMLATAGCPLEKLYRLEVSASHNHEADHMVAAVQSDDNNFYVIGDTFEPIYPAQHMKHEPIRYNCLSENSPEFTWRIGAPWVVVSEA